MATNIKENVFFIFNFIANIFFDFLKIVIEDTDTEIYLHPNKYTISREKYHKVGNFSYEYSFQNYSGDKMFFSEYL